MGRRLGQHFLHDQSVLGKILAAAELRPEDQVLEVGPGKGVLTARLLETGARVTAIEVDPALAESLREKWGGHERFNLIEGDILKADLSPRPLFGNDSRFAIVANLPYYLSSPFLFRVIARRQYLTRMVLMVQREIADRLVAMPETGKTYGSLSIAGHHVFSMKRLFLVPPGAFTPPPKVDSAVVGFEPRPPRLNPDDERTFLEHVQKIFTQRRKILLSTVQRFHPGLSEHQIEQLRDKFGKARPDALSPEAHLEFFALLRNLSLPD